MVSSSEEGEARRMDSGNRGPTDLAVTGEFGDLGTELLHRTLHSEKYRQAEEAEDLEVSACASGNRLGGQSVHPASEHDYGAARRFLSSQSHQPHGPSTPSRRTDTMATVTVWD
jgi:hypothetical protein